LTSPSKSVSLACFDGVTLHRFEYKKKKKKAFCFEMGFVRVNIWYTGRVPQALQMWSSATSINATKVTRCASEKIAQNVARPDKFYLWKK
jgi:hypothetical protein